MLQEKIAGVTYCEDEIVPVSLTHKLPFYLGGRLFNSFISTAEHLKVTLQINYFVHLSLTSYISCPTWVVLYFLFIWKISSLGLITNQSIMDQEAVSEIPAKCLVLWQNHNSCHRLIPMLPSTWQYMKLKYISIKIKTKRKNTLLHLSQNNRIFTYSFH